MAKYEVTYRCGHTAEVQVFGPHKQRDQKLAWYRDVAVCPNCYRARKEAEEAQATEGLVALVGTEKQVAWANSLRAQLIQEINSRFGGRGGEKGAKALTLLPAAINEKTDARWWIDHRDDLCGALSPIWQAKVREAGLL